MLALREQLTDAKLQSDLITERLVSLPEFEKAQSISTYVGRGAEVETLSILHLAWSANKRLAVPCCVGDQLELYWIEHLDELAPRTLGILEPKKTIRQCPQRKACVTSLDLIVVPGVAFDLRGGRLGYGKGYYDRLLRQANPETALVAPAFDCQIVPEVPMLGHDIYMHKLVTASSVHSTRTGVP
jgi:5-formyltetrahydrofolate cyclo-ligase